ncbi:hypothetical protein BMF94_3606 [Rhodotorula taiwanensis]|uniref:Karyogamy protein n=1 Tax=Rhodotorula taiwanensis TaxID=741276 RepID=A0A2S5B921_9BASI|nr:hypothetical protein BMF94_3606 [Rhodotorula taiwanensis]
MSLHDQNGAPGFAILEDSQVIAPTCASPSSVPPQAAPLCGSEPASDSAALVSGSEKAGESSLSSSVSSVTSEQAILSISSKVTDLLMAIQEISTVLFEVQELRHSATIDAQGSADGCGEEIDEMLGQLATKLDAVGTLYAQVDEEVSRTLDTPAENPGGEISFLRQKWADAASDWDGVQADAEQLTEELKEDKWLVVFRTVSQQADDMQQSLEKALTQCALFMSDVEPQLSAGGVALSDAKRQHLLATCSALHRSLDAKVKYYSPACERALTILGKGIADRSTKNGEALRRLGEMKTSWAAVQQRIELVDADLASLEHRLTSASVEPPSTGQRRLSSIGATLSPPRQRQTHVDASPTRRQPHADRHPGLGPMSLHAPILGTVSPPQSRSPKATPPRPPKSLKRYVSDSHASHSASGDKHTPLIAITPRPVAHRRSLSALAGRAGPAAVELVSEGSGRAGDDSNPDALALEVRAAFSDGLE